MGLHKEGRGLGSKLFNRSVVDSSFRDFQSKDPVLVAGQHPSTFLPRKKTLEALARTPLAAGLAVEALAKGSGCGSDRVKALRARPPFRDVLHDETGRILAD